jgi:hypothetical protein
MVMKNSLLHIEITGITKENIWPKMAEVSGPSKFLYNDEICDVAL